MKTPNSLSACLRFLFQFSFLLFYLFFKIHLSFADANSFLYCVYYSLVPSSLLTFQTRFVSRYFFFLSHSCVVSSYFTHWLTNHLEKALSYTQLYHFRFHFNAVGVMSTSYDYFSHLYFFSFFFCFVFICVVVDWPC